MSSPFDALPKEKKIQINEIVSSYEKSIEKYKTIKTGFAGALEITS